MDTIFINDALGALLMILQYIAEIIKLTDDKDYN